MLAVRFILDPDGLFSEHRGGFRTIQICPKDVGSACSHSPTRLAGGVRLEAAFMPREQTMFTHQRPLIRFEILAIISICGLLFGVAFRETGHQLWSIPAMTLFFLSGMMFVYAFSKASRKLLQGPQETTLLSPNGSTGPALSAR